MITDFLALKKFVSCFNLSWNDLLKGIKSLLANKMSLVFSIITQCSSEPKTMNFSYSQVPNKRGAPDKQMRSEKIPKFNKRGAVGI